MTCLLISLKTLHSEEVENYYVLPSDMENSIPLELLSEGSNLLKGDVSKNWISFPINEKNSLYDYHYKPSIKFNIETGRVYYWNMIIGWNNFRKGDLRGYFPPFLIEIDCIGERQRSIANMNMEENAKEIVKVRSVPWVKIEEGIKINYCVELRFRKINEIEKLKNEKEIQDKKQKFLM
jgi:hypothetical protein